MSVGFRLLKFRDWRFCWKLANDPGVRAASLDTRPPTWWGHLRWMLQWGRTRMDRVGWVLLDPDAGMAVGVIRVEWSPTGSEIHIALVPEARGKGWGTAALSRITRWAQESFGGCVIARVRAENKASIAAFTKAGYNMTPWQSEGTRLMTWDQK